MEKSGEQKKNFIKWFSEINNKDILIVGGKGASLGEMYNNKFPIPPGFIVTSEAYKYYIDGSGLKNEILDIVNKIDVDDSDSLEKNSAKVREMIINSEMPEDLGKRILEAYEVLDVEKNNLSEAKGSALDILKTSHEPPFVAVRSSATTEDLADASFAGQQESFLNVKGQESLIEKVKRCFASLFTARAVYYRKKKGFKHEDSLLAVVVQKMINSDKSGVIFSKNPLKEDNSLVVEAVWGLGEGIVSGKILPDNYILNDKLEILEYKISDKLIALVRDSSGNTSSVKLTPEKSKKQVLTGHELKILSQFALRLEKHYKKPQDIEFAIEDEEIFIVQSRPITTKVKSGEKEVSGNVLFSGLPASPGISSGVVKIIDDLSELSKIKEGDVLVTKMTNPDMVISMQKASAIVTDEGGITSHAAIVSREMGIPAVVGTRVATENLKNGQAITVDGFTGRILEGKAEERKVEIKSIVPTKTKIKVIVDIPDYAERAAKSGVEGVGLSRMEGLIAVSGKHPLWFLKNDSVNEYISVVNEGLKKISRPFKEIWIRTSDIRSDEYKNLKGAPQKIEGNPMLGDHGIRFSLKNQDILEAEFKAIKELADDFPEKKFGIMMPQVISVEEVRESKKIAEEIGFPSNVKIGIMIETPAAVMIIEDLVKEGIDFVSFGTNDLTQYTLALDRNNEEVQNLYNEYNPAILNSIKKVIEVCKRNNVETSICGQAGSREDMAEFLVKEGIDSISVNADAAFKVSSLVAKIENGGEPINSETLSNGGENSFFLKDNEEEKEEKIEDEPNPNEIIPEISQEVNYEQNKEVKSDEDLILKALGESSAEDNYNPSLEKEKDIDVPKLNDSIPVESDHLESEKSEENIVDILDDDETEEINFEEQQKERLEEEVEKEIEGNPYLNKEKFGPEKEWKKKEEDEMLDIF
ncbi:phosphoenolpyruvate synthase [Candidatus Parvarchaeota archaeon]|jgi:pyruvate,water dikinase|nr:MAG: phosphoenolpyruvate synthase [Candidatus Parvarchaeota archaeon]HIG52247.1 phosphoenolpyruvate synthase [Candidatus Pacearchaeota archaeon]